MLQQLDPWRKFSFLFKIMFTCWHPTVFWKLQLERKCTFVVSEILFGSLHLFSRFSRYESGKIQRNIYISNTITGLGFAFQCCVMLWKVLIHQNNGPVTWGLRRGAVLCDSTLGVQVPGFHFPDLGPLDRSPTFVFLEMFSLISWTTD